MNTVFDLKNFIYRKTSQNATTKLLVRELIRKSIHICSAFTVLLAHFFFDFTIIFLVCGIVCYIVCEILRLSGIPVPVISALTEAASRKADEGKIVLGPITLGIGILLSLLLFDKSVAAVAIFAVSFGDGLASLVGKIYGHYRYKLIPKKTVAGSLACFLSVSLSSFFILMQPISAIIVGIVATIVELLPLKNLDNIAIPIIVGIVTAFRLM